MPICPWKHLIVFAFGAGTCILSASLIGTVAYNGKFGDNNKFLKYTYGRDQKIGQLTIANVSLAFICVCFLLLTIVASVKQLPGALILTGWILTFLAFLGTIISQILSLTESKYSYPMYYYSIEHSDVLPIFANHPVPSEYDYYSNEKFKKYLSETGYEVGEDYTTSFGDILKGLGFYNDTAKERQDFLASTNYKFLDFMIPYSYNGDIAYVPSCNLSNKGILMGSFTGIDPCNYVIVGSNSKCIGGWNVDNFKNYWCYLYRQTRDTNKTIRKKNDKEKLEYYAEKTRNFISVTSYAAFYEINTIFLGLNCAGFFVLLISIFLNMAFRPFDTNVEDYQKLVSGQEAKSDDSSNAKPKSKEPVRAKAISESDDED